MAKFVFICTTIALMVSCKTHTRKDFNRVTNLNNSGELRSDVDEINEDNESDTGTKVNERLYLSPFEAQAVVEREVSLGDSLVIEGFKVPCLKIKFDKADFVQILRCNVSYKMTTMTGEDIRNLDGRPGRQSALRWVWAMAVEDRRHCKWVGKRIVSKDFPDLTAPKGKYYYVINPCILSENSLLKKEGCSNNLMMTGPVTVSDSFRSEVRTKNQELSEAEASLNANLLTAQHLAKKIEIHLSACENMVASDKALNDFKKALVQIAFIPVGIAAGIYLPKGLGRAAGGKLGKMLKEMSGPNSAVLASQMLATVGASLFYTKVLGLPSDVFNECIDPNVVATTEEQRKNAGKGRNAADNDARQRGKYAEEYQVQALSKKLETMLAQDGPITRDRQRVQKILEELRDLDVQILTLDKVYSEATNLGIDLKDISNWVPEP